MHPWILGLWLCSAPVSEWQPVERVVAVVDDDIVLASELDRRIAIASVALAKLPDPAERDRRAAGLRRELLQTLIDEHLIAQAADRLSITIEESQLDAAIAQIRDFNHADDAAIARAIADAGWTMAEYRLDLGRQLLRYKLFSSLPIGRTAMSDDAVRAAHAAEKAKNPSLGDLAAETDRLRTVLFERAMNEWLAEARRTAHVELRP